MHRFYLGRPGTGFAYLGLTSLSILLTAVAIGIPVLVGVAFFALFEAINLLSMTDERFTDRYCY